MRPRPRPRKTLRIARCSRRSSTSFNEAAAAAAENGARRRCQGAVREGFNEAAAAAAENAKPAAPAPKLPAPLQ